MISSDQFFQLDFDKTSTSEEKKNQIKFQQRCTVHSRSPGQIKFQCDKY